MRPFAIVVVLVSLCLGIFAVQQSSELLSRSGVRSEVGRIKRIELSAALARRLASLKDDLTLTYYVSPAADMPSHLRRLERDVTDLLRAMRAAGGGRVDYRIVDPTQEADLKRFAGRRKVAPVRVRSVAQDSYSEREVWSTLTIAYGPRTPAMIGGLGPEHLPRLQNLFIEHIDQLEAPRKPVFAVAAPAEGYRELRAYLAQAGRVVECNFEINPRVPQDADVLFWIEPGAVNESLLRNLHNFIANGRSVVVAGGAYRADVDAARGVLRLRDSGYDAEALLGGFGIQPVAGLLLDHKEAPMALPTGEEQAPFRVLSLALNQDFQALANEPRGSLLFNVPTPFALDAERLAEGGWAAEVLATSSDESALVDEPGPEVPLIALGTAGRPVAKQPLLVWLRNVDPWSGTLVACGAANLFRDDTFVIDTLAHKRLTGVLVSTLASDERLVTAHAGRDRAEPLPALSGAQRLWWRALVLLLLPGVLLAVLLVRAMQRPARPAGVARAPGFAGFAALRLAVGLIAVVLLAALTRGHARADLTGDRLNALSRYSEEIAAGATGAQRVEAELIASASDRLSPELRSQVARLEHMLGEYAQRGAELHVLRIRPEELSDAEREQLATAGVRPLKVTSRQDEVTTVRNIYCALRLKSGERVEVLPFAGADAFENLEFRLTFALWRLQTGRHPHIAFASDVPRLSAAEVYQVYQSQGLIAPSGKDVYSIAREILSGVDLRVTHVNPREPQLPADIDALVWLQPRRSVTPMLEAMIDYLYRGGRVMVAAQHFVMQSRQYRGTEFKFNYWPQPQSPDIEEFYYPGLGVLMVREVLFDAVSTIADLTTILYRAARREFVAMRHAKSFLIRSVPPNYADSPITRNLGDLPFLFGAFFRLDQERLAALGLKATELIRTSPRAWSLDWKGGWLSDGYLPGPGEPILKAEAEAAGRPMVDDDGNPLPYPEQFVGPVPLAVLVEGQFPWPEKVFEFPPKVFLADGQMQEPEPLPDYPHKAPVDRAAPGRLLLVGNSEMFKDDRLTELRPTFRPDQLLLNAVAALALEPPLAEVITRRSVARGFEPVVGADRLRWRGVVLGALPALMGLLFVARFLALRITARS